MGRKEGRWQLIIVSVYVHCKTHRKRTDIEMNETLNLHRQRTKWTADIELDKTGFCRFPMVGFPKRMNGEIVTSQISSTIFIS